MRGSTGGIPRGVCALALIIGVIACKPPQPTVMTATPDLELTGGQLEALADCLRPVALRTQNDRYEMRLKLGIEAEKVTEATVIDLLPDDAEARACAERQGKTWTYPGMPDVRITKLLMLTVTTP